MSSGFRNLLLGIFILLVIAVFVRFQGQVDREDGIYLRNLKPGKLYARTFELKEEGRVVVEGKGSLVYDTLLAAYGWVLQLPEGHVMWRLAPGSGEGKNGMVYQRDTLFWPAGTYRIYFTTLGEARSASSQGLLGQLERLLGNDASAWKKQASQWFLHVRPEGAWREIRRDVVQKEASTSILWEGSPLGNDQYVDVWFKVRDTLRIYLQAQGEWRSEEKDRGWLEEGLSGKRLWDMTPERTRHAGGVRWNRLGKDTLLLAAGLYHALFFTGTSHAYRTWEANPPYNPTFWGMRLVSLDEHTGVQQIDPWKYFTPLAMLMPAGDEAHLYASFRLQEPTRVWIYVQGEGNRRKLYDRGWIIDKETQVRVWEMRPDSTWHAGGSSKNRFTQAFLTLPAGTYTAFYETDESHAYPDWNSAPPDAPERWGMAVFALDTTLQISGVPLAVPDSLKAEDVLANLTRLGNYAHVTTRFTLEDTTDVFIEAIGELLPSQRADYGWIADLKRHKVVWEMTRQNTVHAGGAFKNRMYRGMLTLPPGTYEVHFVTDNSHAYGAFNAEPPPHPEGWGILIRRKGTSGGKK